MVSQDCLKPCLNDLAEIVRSSELTLEAGHTLVGVVAGHPALCPQRCPSPVWGLLGYLFSLRHF